MTSTFSAECPECSEELTVRFTREEHKVHNGIGMQTVAVDEYNYIDDQNCQCNLSEDQIHDLASDAAQEEQQHKEDYGDYKYNMLKDEGRL